MDFPLNILQMQTERTNMGKTGENKAWKLKRKIEKKKRSNQVLLKHTLALLSNQTTSPRDHIAYAFALRVNDVTDVKPPL